MIKWSATIALSNAAIGFLLPALVPLVVFAGSSLASPDSDNVGALLLAGVIVCVTAGVLVGWLRPRGFLGAAVGAGAAVALFMWRFELLTLLQGAAYAWFVVALGELVGITCHSVAARFRRRSVQ